ncbi:MAG: hypothetical protein QGH82_02765, partial [Candidatus Woesearchaeota archaeon]|nr:hypothetical protein [Candidatus Woesearchaeota archaeon]
MKEHGTFVPASEEKQSSINKSLHAAEAGQDPDALNRLLEYLLDPVTGSPAHGKASQGFVCLHVDDLFAAGTPAFLKYLRECLLREYEIGSETSDNIMFVGQRIRWQGDTLIVDQDMKIEELQEIKFEKGSKDDTLCAPAMHTEYRSVLGNINWLQSRTQFHIAYRFSRAASAAAGPTIGDVKELNKVVRTVRAQPVRLTFWPLRGLLRILGYPDAAFKNNADKSSQRGQCIFIGEARKGTKGSTDPVRGSLVDYESTKIKRTTLSTTVAELYSFMKCFGTCQFLRGLWCDIASVISPIHMRTDANNLVTTAGTTHLPEQKETVHMIQMLRKEACSGAIEDLAHIPTRFCLSDPLTKSTINPSTLIEAVQTGKLPWVDVNPPFRSMIQHKAFESEEHFHKALLCLDARPWKDYWQLCNNTLIRHHVTPRRALFDPTISKDIPIDLARLQPERLTNVMFVTESSENLRDVWIAGDREPKLLPDYWI